MRSGKGGGHAYSMDHISKSISQSGVDIAILSIGIRESDNFLQSTFYLGNIFFNGANFWVASKKIRNVVNKFDPDIIHCFDYNCYNVFKTINLNNKYKFVLNKCGGPNQSSYPRGEDVVLFSRENEIWFKENSRYNKTNFYLIPNRVNKVKLETDIQIKKPENIFTFVRIIRIGPTYKNSILQSIDLISLLSEQGFNVKLYVIGVIENSETYNELVDYAEDKNVSFLVEDQYTTRASKMLYLADAVIATGRGFMEASSLGIPVLSVANNCKYPILVTDVNFDDFFKINFSGRLNYANEDSNIPNLIKLISDRGFYNECRKSLQKYFERYFDVNKATEAYLRVYDIALKNEKRIPLYFDFLNKVRTFRSFFLHSKRYK